MNFGKKMNIPVRSIVLVIITLALSVLYSKSDVEYKDGSVKVRAMGICYLDPGISEEQARLLSKYDAINEALEDLGSFLEDNDSLTSYPNKKMFYVKFLSNQLDVLVYREGEESIDGYPSYVSYLSSEINIKKLNELLFKIRTDNKFRYLLEIEYARFRLLIKDIDFLKITTNKIPDNFITGLTNKLTSTDWANKAHLTPEEGLKIEFYSIAVDIDRLYESSYIFLSESMIRAGQNSLVMGILNKLINLDPLNFSAAYSVRGYINYIDKQYAAAIKELEKSIAIEPSFAYAYCILGKVLTELRKTEEALKKYASAIELDPDYYLPYLYRADLYRKNGKYDEALSDYSKVISLNPKNLESYFSSGIIYYLTGKYSFAAEEFSKAIYLDELTPSLYYNRAISYRKSGENEKAVEDYKTFLLMTVNDLDENNTEPLIQSWMNESDLKPILPE